MKAFFKVLLSYVILQCEPGAYVTLNSQVVNVFCQYITSCSSKKTQGWSWRNCVKWALNSL